MSEYEFYEFRSVDRPLTSDEMDQLGELSSRANVTPSSFVVEYNYSSFRGKPEQLMERYFDAFVYVANWGTRRLMLRLPTRAVDLPAIEEYANEKMTFWVKNEFVILSFEFDEDGGGGWEEGGGWMSKLIDLREELLNGDFRSLYLGWLEGILIFESDQSDFLDEDEDEDELEPPVPPGLRTLTAAQDALVSFLKIDQILVEAAAEFSPPSGLAESSQAALEKWLKALPVEKKDAWLLKLTSDAGKSVRSEIMLEFRESQRKSKSSVQRINDESPRRTIGELRAARASHVEIYEGRQAKKAAAKKAQEAKLVAKKRSQELDALSKRVDAAWSEIDQRLKTTSSLRYIDSLRDLTDLCELAERDHGLDDYRTRLNKFLRRHADSVKFIERIQKAGLMR